MTVFSRMSVCIIKRHILIRDMLVGYTKWINTACQGLEMCFTFKSTGEQGLNLTRHLKRRWLLAASEKWHLDSLIFCKCALLPGRRRRARV